MKFNIGDIVVVINSEYRWQGEFKVVRYITPQPFKTPAVECMFLDSKNCVVIPEIYLELKS